MPARQSDVLAAGTPIEPRGRVEMAASPRRPSEGPLSSAAAVDEAMTSARFAAFERDFRSGATDRGLSEHAYTRAHGVWAEGWEESAALTVQGDRAAAERYAIQVRDRYGQEAVATFEEDDRAPGAMYRLEGDFDREAVRGALTRHGFPAGRLVGGALEVGVERRTERKNSKKKDAEARIYEMAASLHADVDVAPGHLQLHYRESE